MASRTAQRRGGPTQSKEPKTPKERRIVVVVVDDSIQVLPDGVSQIEAPTLLRLGARAVEKQLGLVD